MRSLAWLLCVILCLLGLEGTAAAEGACAAGNLLHEARPVLSQGFERPELLTDGWESPDGSHYDHPQAATFSGTDAYVVWDLGGEVPIVAASLQGDNNDYYHLHVSTDGRTWHLLWQTPAVGTPGLQPRYTRELGARARYLRVSGAGGDGKYSLTEVKVFCEAPAIWPPLRLIRAGLQENELHTGFWQMNSTKAVLGLGVLLFLLLVMPRLPRATWRRRAQWALIALGVVAWHNLGHFQTNREMPNPWDIYHYHLNSKYFPELGYFELYQCTAKAERELGRGADMDAHGIRDLRDNRLYPGQWSNTPEGACRAKFSPERWEEFKADIDSYHRLGEGNAFLRCIVDHGFNSPPPNAAWIRLTTSWITATDTSLALMTLIDSSALIASIALVYWGFGGSAAALFALVMGFGFPWAHHWLGGSLGRVVWVVFAAGGFALLKKDRPFWGAAALAAATALRMFPIVFLGGLGLYVIIRWLQAGRRLERTGKQLLLGMAVGLAVTTAAGAVVMGPRAYPEFVSVMQRHSQVHSSNVLGLPQLLAWQPNELGAMDNRLSDPTEVWKAMRNMRLKERLPIRLGAILAALALTAWAALRRSPPWQVASVAGLLIFAGLNLSSYDYCWIALLAPLAALSRRLTWLLLGCAVVTMFEAVFIGEILERHHYMGVSTLLCFVAFGVAFVREQRSLAGLPEPE